MTESTDLIRRLDSAISTKSLHPEYARGLLREARDALETAVHFTEDTRPVVLDFPWDEDGEAPDETN
jgi:hypothetical protein